MTDRPRWPRGTPNPGRGKPGPGPGRFRDTPEGRAAPAAPDWAEQVSARLERQRQWPNPDVVTPADIARELGVTRAAVTNWRARHADFPEPVTVTVGERPRRYYSMRQVREWYERRYGGRS